MKTVMLNVIKRAKQTRFFAWFGGLSFMLRIVICAITVAVIAGMVWGTASYIQRLGDDSEKPSLGSDEDVGLPPGANGGEYDAPATGSETASLPETEQPDHSDVTDSDEPSDADNEASDVKHENSTEEDSAEEQLENDSIAFQENIYNPTWVMDDVIMVSAGDCYTMAIKNDGSLWGWGGNIRGQLGIGSDESQRTAVWIMDDVVFVSAGFEHTMAIKSDGSLWGWGNNWHGQLGFAPQTVTIDEYHEDPVKIMDDVTAVSAGTRYVMAIRTDGSLWAWGWNVGGMLGIS